MTKSHVYVFGSGDCGQLGLGEDCDTVKKPRLHPFFEQLSIVSIVAGGLHSLALTSVGEVYSWGCNDEKALGHGAPEYTVAKVEGLEGVRITQVAAGDSISAALSEEGRVYTWGTFRDSKGVLGHHRGIGMRKRSRSDMMMMMASLEVAEGAVLMQDRPMLIESLVAYKVVSIAAGSNHLMAVTADGQLFAWGSGEQGQLGRRILERHKTLALRPSNVTPRFGRRRLHVRRVVCGSYHTLVFGATGFSDSTSSSSLNLAVQQGTHSTVILAMGLNNFGQLGLADHEDRIIAEAIDASHFNAVPVEAGAGEHHSLVLCSNGQIFAFGRGDSGQLGISLPEGTRACNIPIPVTSMPEAAHLIAAGGNHNLAVTQSNRLYAWGYGDMHQLGHGPDRTEVLPRLVETKMEGRIVQVAAGGQHSVILTYSAS